MAGVFAPASAQADGATQVGRVALFENANFTGATSYIDGLSFSFKTSSAAAG